MQPVFFSAWKDDPPGTSARRLVSRTIRVALIMTLGSVSFLRAGSTWDGGAGSALWGQMNNWNPNGLPTNNADIVMRGTVVTTNQVNTAIRNYRSLTFSNSAAAFLLRGLPLTNGVGGLTSFHNRQLVISNEFFLSANQTWTSSSNTLQMVSNINLQGFTLNMFGNTVTNIFQGRITGAGGLTKNGTGMLMLTGAPANSYSGATIVSNGTLWLMKAGAVTNTSPVTLNTNGTLLLGVQNAVRTNAVTLAGGVISVGNATTNVLGALTLTGDSAINLLAGGNINVLRFTNTTYTAGILTINNWTGAPHVAGTDDKIFLSANAGGASFLDSVVFAGVAGSSQGATWLGSGEIVPVPEPGAVMGGLMVAGLLLNHYRRKKDAPLA